MTISGDAHPHAVVWIDTWHALVARSNHGRRTITEVERQADPALGFLLHVAHETEDCELLMILGPDDARLAFAREYVALYQRPERLIDVEAMPEASRSELVDRLRLLDGEAAAAPV